MIPESPENAQTEAFLQEMLRSQVRLAAWIQSLTGDSSLTDDLLQETNLILWRKSADFRPGTNFFAWASRIAFRQVKDYRKRENRKPLIFSDELLDRLAVTMQTRFEQSPLEERVQQLRICLGQLPHHQYQMLRQRYEEDRPLKELSRNSGRSENALAAALYRIRLVLLHCLEQQLAHSEGKAHG